MDNLCCKVNPAKECRSCHKKFCPEHVYADNSRFRYPPVPVPSECFECYHVYSRIPFAATTRRGLSARDLYLEVRKICPTGYITISTTLQDANPGLSTPTIEWAIYHERYKHFKDTTPELVLAAFKAAVQGVQDPTVSTVSSNDF